MKQKNTFKRLFSGIMSLSITASVVSYFPVFADEQAEPYPYTMFAASREEGAIILNINNSCINGNIAANGSIMTTAQNFNVNGQRIENADEIDYGTNPQLTDTDGDELSDYDEIYVYGTDPLKYDSDGDGLKDGTEIKLGLDPNNPQTFSVPGSEYQILQPVSPDNDILSAVNTEDSPYIMSIDIISNNDIEENIFVSESEHSGIIENDAMIGKSIDIDISEKCSPSSMIVNFAVSDEYINNTLGTYDKIERFKGIKRLAVFKYFDEINALLSLCTEYDIFSGCIW